MDAFDDREEVDRYFLQSMMAEDSTGYHRLSTTRRRTCKDQNRLRDRRVQASEGLAVNPMVSLCVEWHETGSTWASRFGMKRRRLGTLDTDQRFLRSYHTWSNRKLFNVRRGLTRTTGLSILANSFKRHKGEHKPMMHGLQPYSFYQGAGTCSAVKTVCNRVQEQL